MRVRKAFTMRASSIGDALMGKYFLENVRAAYPEARCVLLVAGNGGLLGELFKEYEWLTVLEASRRHPFALLRAFLLLLGADLALTQYSMGGTFSTASKLFARLVTKRGGLAGFADTWKYNERLYDILLPLNAERAVILNEREALERLGIPVRISEATLPVPRATNLLHRYDLEKDGYLVLHLFSGSERRGLRPEKKEELVRALKSLGIPLVLTGSAKERGKAEALAGEGTLNLTGETSITELVELVSLARAVVSLDTGVAHIAGHVKTPLVVLSSYQGLQWWQREQYRGPVRVLSAARGAETKRKDAEYPESLNSISAERVLEELRTLLG